MKTDLENNNLMLADVSSIYKNNVKINYFSKHQENLLRELLRENLEHVAVLSCPTPKSSPLRPKPKVVPNLNPSPIEAWVELKSHGPPPCTHPPTFKGCVWE